jgi:hypothetical protein
VKFQCILEKSTATAKHVKFKIVDPIRLSSRVQGVDKETYMLRWKITPQSKPPVGARHRYIVQLIGCAHLRLLRRINPTSLPVSIASLSLSPSVLCVISASCKLANGRTELHLTPLSTRRSKSSHDEPPALLDRLTTLHLQLAFVNLVPTLPLPRLTCTAVKLLAARSVTNAPGYGCRSRELGNAARRCIFSSSASSKKGKNLDANTNSSQDYMNAFHK